MFNRIKERLYSIDSYGYITVVIIFVLLIYLMSSTFRSLLSENKVDPNFIVSFTTILVLLTTLSENLKSRKYSYNLNLNNSLQEKGLSVIGKLLFIKNRSEILLGTIKIYYDALQTKRIYVETNITSDSKNRFEENIDLVSAYIDTHFPEEAERWNTLMNDLSQIATWHMNIEKNYQANINLISEGVSFSNTALDSIYATCVEAEELNKKISLETKNMRDNIVNKMNNLISGTKTRFL